MWSSSCLFFLGDKRVHSLAEQRGIPRICLLSKVCLWRFTVNVYWPLQTLVCNPKITSGCKYNRATKKSVPRSHKVPFKLTKLMVVSRAMVGNQSFAYILLIRYEPLIRTCFN